ncbi:uncharacterized protein TNCV_2306321 [Trichonephila clavipes]|nr:uncharacterized protein TNCV_2306321 [Trichonephila clavipes]
MVLILEVLSKFEERYSCKRMWGSRNSDNVERRSGMSVRSLMLIIVGEIGGIRKFCVDRVTADMFIEVITRMVVKEISVSTAGIDFRGMIEDITIDDTNLETGCKC